MSVAFLESERLWYRAPEPDDAAPLHRWINDPRVRLSLGSRFPVSFDGEKRFLEQSSIAVGQSTPDRVVLLFGLKGTDVLLGSTGLFGFDWVARAALWGIFVGDPGQWKKGYGREVARTCLRYAFEELNLNRVGLHVNASNIGGIKAYEAAGFVREGVLREHVMFGGRPEDVVVMSVLRREFLAS